MIKRCKPWESVDVDNFKKIRSELERSYKTVRVASDVESFYTLTELAFVPDKLPKHCRRLAQRSSVDFGENQQGSNANFLADRLRSKRETSNVESSRLVFGRV